MEKSDVTHHNETTTADVQNDHHFESSSDTDDHVAVEALGGESVADMPPHYYRSPAFLCTFLSMGLAYQGAFMFYTMVAGQVGIINEDIGPSPDIIWVLLVYVLCQTIIFTLAGRLSDIFGRRWFFITANALSFTGYMVGGRAQSVDTLIGASILAGIGSGIQQTMPVLMGELVPNKYRHMQLAATFVLFGPISAIGPGLGRTMTTNASWRWIYYTAAMVSGLSGLLQLAFYQPPHFRQLHTKLSRFNALRKLDYVGIAIFTGSATCLLLGLSWGGQKYPWKSGHVIGTIVAGGVGMIVFILWERFGPISDPLVPLFLAKNRNYVALTLVATIGCLVFYALNVIWPTQILTVYGQSPSAAGWITCTLVGGAVFGQFLATVTKRLDQWISMKSQLIICCVLFTAFGGGMAKTDDGNMGRNIVFSIISSMTIGWMEVITLAGAPLVVEPEHMGIATGASYTFRGLFSALAVSIYVTILSNGLSNNSAKYLAPALVEAGLPPSSVVPYITDYLGGNVAGLAKVPGFTPEIAAATAGAAKKVFTESYSTIYLASLSFGFVAILAAIALNGKSFAERLTPNIARRLQNVQAKEVNTEKVASNV